MARQNKRKKHIFTSNSKKKLLNNPSAESSATHLSGSDDASSAHDSAPSQKSLYGYSPLHTIEKTNEKFIKYYQSLNLFDEKTSEWETFMSVCKNPLPASFRISGCLSYAKELAELLENRFLSKLSSVKLPEGSSDTKFATKLTWYPEGMAWSLIDDRSIIRSNDSLKEFHQFLIAQTDVGNITRQEAVSMIPPLLLDVQRGHKVLDMCAAPGSKTSQIIESLHKSCDEAGDCVDDGLVIANDADNKRCYTLTHQAKRLQSPCLVVTNHDATFFPKIPIDDPQTQTRTFLQFDRVLCDVPCSGDGTLRKNLMVWRDWTPMQGAGLHQTQIKILDRACHLLKEGGRIVYSTCSMNPVENEAVVSSILAKYPASIELVDVSAELPGLIRRSGISQWSVMGKGGEMYHSYDQVPEDFKGKLPESLFPQPQSDSLHLNRCLRIYPHLQNTGGFFVAVLHKKGPIGSLDKQQPILAKDASEDDQAKGAYCGFKEKPYFPLAADDAEIEHIATNYAFKAAFPRDQFFVRSTEGKNRTLYYCSASVMRLIRSAYANTSLKVINAGVKAFSRNESSAAEGTSPYRFHHEFVKIAFKSLGARVVRITAADLLECMLREFPTRTSLTAATQKALDAAANAGCVIFHFDEVVRPPYRLNIQFAAWIGKSSATVYLVPTEKQVILDRLKFLGMANESASLPTTK